MISYVIYDVIYDIIYDVQAQGAKTYAGRLRIPLSAGFQQNSRLGLVITMVRSLAYLPCVARNGRQVSWTPSYCTIWSRPTEALASFVPLVALSGRVSTTAAVQRHVAIPSISLAIAGGEGPARSAVVWYHSMISYMTSYYDIINNYDIMIYDIIYDIINYMISYMTSYMISCYLWYHIWCHIWYHE